MLKYCTSFSTRCGPWSEHEGNSLKPGLSPNGYLVKSTLFMEMVLLCSSVLGLGTQVSTCMLHACAWQRFALYSSFFTVGVFDG